MKSLRRWKPLWPLMLTILALPFVAFTQSLTTGAGPEGKTSQPPRPDIVLQESPSPVVLMTTYQRYNGVRRGHEQEIEVAVCAVSSRDAQCPDLNYSSSPEKFALIGFALNPEPGFSVRYLEGRHYRTRPVGTPFESAGKYLMLLKVRAPNNASLGPHVLTGKMRFCKGDQGPGRVWKDNCTLEEIEVRIPILVVGRNDQVSQNTTWHGDKSIARQTVEAVQDVLAGIPSLLICLIDDCH